MFTLLPEPLIGWPTSDELDRYFSATGGLQPPNSADSSVTEVLVRRTSVTPQQRVHVLVHRRVTSAADPRRDSAASGAGRPDHGDPTATAGGHGDGA